MGLAWLRRPAPPTWDDDGAIAISARQVQLVRDAGALAELPLHLSALGAGSGVDWATSPAPPRLIAESRQRRGGDREPRPRRSRCCRLLALQGREAEAVRADRGRHRARRGARAGIAAMVRALGGRGPLQRPRPLRGGGRGGRRSRPRTTSEPLAVHVGAARAGRGGRARRRRRARARCARRGWRRRRSPAGTDFALGIEARSRALLERRRRRRGPRIARRSSG